MVKGDIQRRRKEGDDLAHPLANIVQEATPVDVQQGLLGQPEGPWQLEHHFGNLPGVTFRPLISQTEGP